MPTFKRISADSHVEAICLTRETRVDTPFGAIKGVAGDWLVTDYGGRPALYSITEFQAKFDVFDQEATDYLNIWKWCPGPVITAIEPGSGAIGTTIFLAGRNFRGTVGNSKVYFGIARQVNAVVVSWATDFVSVTVPTGLLVGEITEICVVVGGVTSNRVQFHVA